MGTRDPAERVELMKHYQKVYTENLDGIGLTAYPGALIVNKRFANIPPGAPIFMYNWAEDNIIRERVFVPEDKQLDAEPSLVGAAIRESFPEASECAVRLAGLLELRLGADLTSDEVSYLALHVARVTTPDR